jgi:hypothetical protein
MKWFEKQQAITIEKLTPLPVVLEEIFQRRHLLVHNGGIVNRKYLEKLDNLSFPPALGEQLGVNYDYLIGAVECLSTTGVMIVCLVIKGLFPSSQVPSHFVQFATDEATLQKRYLLANQLCSMFLPHVSDEIIRKKLHYAILLAKKELFGLEVINDEVITLKNATSDELWKLLYLVLLDDFDEAAKLGNELLKINTISPDFVWTSPHLREIRHLIVDPSAPRERTFEEMLRSFDEETNED